MCGEVKTVRGCKRALWGWLLHLSPHRLHKETRIREYKSQSKIAQNKERVLNCASVVLLFYGKCFFERGTICIFGYF